ncbi:pyridoxine 5'-phosphate synthase [bacterium]|nr:pyridoxine 5'-phosphate synthase [bacterium]
MIRLGVNVDHVATLRQARRTVEPDPVWAAALAELAGADQITVHLREDRRHIQDRDVEVLRRTVRTRLNLEMGASEEITAIALALHPDQATLVPEKRQEVTTEGGLDVAKHRAKLADVIARLKGAGIRVSLFIDPEIKVTGLSAAVGADAVEFHTGAYANAVGPEAVERELTKLSAAAELAASRGLAVYAGHGLNYWNITAALAIPALEEVNIGHSIISRAVLVGLERAVREMKELLK